jgi:hypothetical protein
MAKKKESVTETRYYEWDGAPCRVHRNASGQLTADIYYAKFGHVPLRDPEAIENESLQISRERYDEFVEVETRWFKDGIYRTDVPAESGAHYIWRGRAAVIYRENGEKKAAVFVGPDRFYPEDLWYFEWADVVPGRPYPAPTSPETFEWLVAAEIDNYNLAKKNAEFFRKHAVKESTE